MAGDYAWNRTGDETLPSGLQRTFDWEEVDAVLHSLVHEMEAAEPLETSGLAQGSGGDAEGDSSVGTGTDAEGRVARGGEASTDEAEVDATGGEGADAGLAVGENGIEGEVIDGVLITTTSDVPVIAVEASKTVGSLVQLASAQLAKHEAVCLRSLEKVRGTWSMRRAVEGDGVRWVTLCFLACGAVLIWPRNFDPPKGAVPLEEVWLHDLSNGRTSGDSEN